jgi:hypothetical protein
MPSRNAQLQWCVQEFQQIAALCAEAIMKGEEALDNDSVDAQVARARSRAIRAKLPRTQKLFTTVAGHCEGWCTPGFSFPLLGHQTGTSLLSRREPVNSVKIRNSFIGMRSVRWRKPADVGRERAAAVEFIRRARS